MLSIADLWKHLRNYTGLLNHCSLRDLDSFIRFTSHLTDQEKRQMDVVGRKAPRVEEKLVIKRRIHTKELGTLSISSEQVSRAFYLNALLRDCAERGEVLVLPDVGDNDDRLKLAMEAQNKLIISEGQVEQMNHHRRNYTGTESAESSKSSIGVCRRSIWASSTNIYSLTTTTTTIDDAHPPSPPRQRRLVTTATSPPSSTFGRIHLHPSSTTSAQRMMWQCHVTYRTSAGHDTPLPPHHGSSSPPTQRRHAPTAHHYLPRNDDGAACEQSPPDVLRRLTVATHNVVTVYIRFHVYHDRRLAATSRDDSTTTQVGNETTNDVYRRSSCFISS
ncbi:hypothetical protein K443DRAFT_13404 [Laccaria amethystina LaAM-08-1]|uniref:Uncharacterized protein n=1 Tax=Laccaria amethystina LaAM-08-1 TaxID=1095629 RepID=A0A0C9WVF5_9AGAR|nr:hypothetical protein K443DRAFT_13404 [Laccaria amethystina LaAM-08-1]